MKKTILFLFTFIISAGLFAQTKKSTTSAGGALQTSIERGKQVYTASCLTCHQADGSGVPNLNPPLIQTKWVLGDKSTLIQMLLKGSKAQVEIDGDMFHNTMPAQPQLTDQQIADVLTYVRNSFGNKTSSVKITDVKSARKKLKSIE